MELPPLPPLTNDQQENRVIFHDIAQHLMAKELGFETGRIFVGTRFGQPTSLSKNSSKTTTKLDSSAGIATHLRKRIMVLCAGVISEFEWFQKLPEFLMEKDHANTIYNNGLMDGFRLTDHHKIQELLIILHGIEREPSENDDLLENQKYEIFSVLYREAECIFNSFSEKLFTLYGLVINENWDNCGLIVNGERLAELEAEAEAADQASEKSIIA